MPSFKKDSAIHYPLSLVRHVTDFLVDSIINGRLAPGERLIENDLQRRFSISRGPIRESLRILEKDGFVVTSPRKGTFVRKITQKDVEENFPIRANLEGLAARSALDHIRQKDIARMELALSKMEQAAQKKNLKAYLKQHLDFHETFILASKNDTLVEILQNLRRQAMWFSLLYFYVSEALEDELRVHREILNLFIQRDVNKLENLVRGHILGALTRFLDYIATKSG